MEFVSDFGGFDATPVGVDGCGAPVQRTTTRAMALLYAHLSSLAELRQVFVAMHRYPALVSGYGNGDAILARSTNSAAKRGAEGCVGVAVEGRLGVAAKSWDGNQAVADQAMAATLVEIGVATGHSATRLEGLLHPAVHGGGKTVGELETRLEMRWA